MKPASAQHLDVAYVARLARLQLTAAEIARLQGQLEQVLAHVRKLQEVDVTGVEPTAHAMPIRHALRPDEVRAGVDRDEVLRNAPAESDGQFLVPRIIE